MIKTLENIDKTLIRSAANRALIAADALYFTWNLAQQERFRVTMPDAAATRARRVLLDCLLDRQCKLEEVDQVWRDIPHAELNVLNWASLLINGLGENCIYLNEHLSEDKSLLSFPTLYDYDYDHYLFQQEANEKEFNDYERTDYYAWRFSSWIRLLINGEFHYGTITSVASHVGDELHSAGNKEIDRLIPHRFVRGDNHGKPESGGFLLDQRIDAQGLEGQLAELRTRWYRYLSDRWIDVSKSMTLLQPAAYVIDSSWEDDDPLQLFVFNNAEALKKIRWRHFSRDCEKISGDANAAEELVLVETERAIDWLNHTYTDIVNNFDPKVTKFKRRRKVVLTPGALDDLNRLGFTDDD